jgi:hypothetical protein
MADRGNWLFEFAGDNCRLVDGLVPVVGYVKSDRPPEEVAVMEKAAFYKADAVFFEASRDGKPSVAQAFVYRSESSVEDPEFGKLHQQLWSWGGVPLVYRVTRGLVQLFRCAHRPDFERNRQIVCQPFKTLKLATTVSADPWWDADRLRNGTLWDDPDISKKLLSSQQAAQKTLIKAVRRLYVDLTEKSILPKPLRRRLLILSVLIAYLEARKVFEPEFFGRFLTGANKFFQVLANGAALISLLEHLEERFNGHVFILTAADREALTNSNQLGRFARLVEARHEAGGQLTLWERYSFADLPVELISHVYQLFVSDTSVAVYTPHFVVRLMLGEVMSWDRLDRLQKENEVILDGACGSGIFLVEAYKRLILHWRFRNNWRRPSQAVLKELLTSHIRGIDLEEGAVELAAFSLCLALCDALEPMEIRASVKLFPPLTGEIIHAQCFFKAREQKVIPDKVGVIVGNPPFTSLLVTDSAKRAYQRYRSQHGPLPDKQLAYLFLHESMEMLVRGGVLSMVQQYNFLYNQLSLGFRRKFISRWDVREIFDFISVRGLFQKGGADTKVVVVVAEAQPPPAGRHILHATFRRSGRADAEQGFDIDYYDMHWLPRHLALENDAVWRADTVGGGRVLTFVERLRKLKTLGRYAAERQWDFGEGWIEGKKGKRSLAPHITGKPWLQSRSLTDKGVVEDEIQSCTVRRFKSAYTEKRFSPPMLLVRSQSDIHHAVWTKSYLTYTQRIIGFCAANKDLSRLRAVAKWLELSREPLQAFLAATSPRIFTQKSSALSNEDIVSLPFDESGAFRLTTHEKIIASDIANYYRDFIRLGEASLAMRQAGVPALPAFNHVFAARVNSVYKKNNLRALQSHAWGGVVCQPFIFGNGEVDWNGADELHGRLDALLREKRGAGLNVTRVARLYDGACVYLLKPDRLRYWLRSIALRDADETLADLSQQGF